MYCDQYTHLNGEHIIWSNFIAEREVIGNMCRDRVIPFFIFNFNPYRIGKKMNRELEYYRKMKLLEKNTIFGKLKSHI